MLVAHRLCQRSLHAIESYHPSATPNPRELPVWGESNIHIRYDIGGKTKLYKVVRFEMNESHRSDVISISFFFTITNQ
jgi:hypothetical protein